MTGKEFDIMFRALYLPLGMYAMRIVGDADIAEDIVQDAFMKILLQMDEGKEITDFKSYMYRSVRNECISYLRGKKETESLDSVPEIDEEVVDTSLRDAKIWRAIDALPEKCREVFLMSKRDGLSNEEIADELNISIKTVRNQITKALARLREALSDGHKPFFLPFL